MTTRFLCALLLLSAAACDGELTTLDETRTYSVVIPPFETAEECREAAGNPIFNCEPSITLCPNGGYMMAETDIVNEGRYTIDGDRLVAKLAGEGDVASTIHATISNETLISADLPFGQWKRRAVIIDDDCENLEGRDWW